MTIGPVPPYVTAAPQPLTGLLIGAAVTFGIAASQGPTFAAEYIFGTHAAALVTAEAQKSQQRGPVAGGAPARIGAYVIAGPAPFDPNVQMPMDVQAPAVAGARPRIASFVTAAPGPFDPNVPAPVDPNAPATGGARPRIGAVTVAAPSPFDPNVIAPQTFDIAFPLRSGALGKVQWAAGPFDPTLATVQVTAPAAPQGPLFSAEYTFGTQAQALYDAEARKSQQWGSARAAALTGAVRAYQWSAPVPLDVIQGWIETPTFNPQGGLVPFQDAAPGDLWALAPRVSASAAAPPPVISVPLRMQWAAPQPLDAIAAFTITARMGPQGPTVRAFIAWPSDPTPTGAVGAFTFARAGAAPTTGPVPPYASTQSSPVDPAPSAAQKFSASFGGSLPVVARYQVGAPQAVPDLAPVWAKSVIGPTLAFTYQGAWPQPLDALAAQIQKASTPGTTTSRAIGYQFVGSQPLDGLAAQTVSARPSALTGRVPPYGVAAPQPLDQTLQAVVVRGSVGYQGPTVRSFVAAPQRMESTLQGLAWTARYSVGSVYFANVPTVRFMIADYSHRIVLSDNLVRIVLN